MTTIFANLGFGRIRKSLSIDLIACMNKSVNRHLRDDDRVYVGTYHDDSKLRFGWDTRLYTITDRRRLGDYPHAIHAFDVHLDGKKVGAGFDYCVDDSVHRIGYDWYDDVVHRICVTWLDPPLSRSPISSGPAHD